MLAILSTCIQDDTRRLESQEQDETHAPEGFFPCVLRLFSILFRTVCRAAPLHLPW